MNRPKILPEFVPNYEQSWSQYPDSIRVSFGNGRTLKYVIDIQQPEPVLGKLLDRYNHICFGGYKYKQKGIGKRTGRVMDNGQEGTAENL